MMDPKSLSSAADGQLPEELPKELRGALARCEQVLQSSVPVLRHLVGNSESSLFHEEVLARVRGMLDHLGSQMLRRYLDMAGRGEDEPIPLAELDALVTALLDDEALLAHVHAAAIEWRITQRLAERRSSEIVLTPLVQELVGSENADTARLGMNFLTAQARFAQHARRLQLELGELPSDLLNSCLKSLRRVAGNRADARRDVQMAIRKIQDSFDEGATRLGLASRLVTGTPTRAAALDPEHAGIPLFAAALAEASGVSRDVVMLGIAEGQAPRLGLMLRAAALDRRQVERTVLMLHPDARLPEGLGEIDRHTAASLLKAGPAGTGGR